MKIHKTNLKASSFLHMIAAASITVCMLTSCNGGLTEQSESDPAGTYRNYLLEVRKTKSISFDELAENLCQWQTMEKPRDFDPFGQAGLPPLATI